MLAFQMVFWIALVVGRHCKLYSTSKELKFVQHPHKSCVASKHCEGLNTTTNRFVSLSASVAGRGSIPYLQYLPFIIDVYAAQGVSTIISLTVSNTAHIERANFLKSQLHGGADVRIVHCGHVPNPLCSQLCRLLPLFVGDHIGDNDVIALSDTDMLPLNSSLFVPRFVPHGSVHSFNGMCCDFRSRNGRRFRMLPMHSLAAQKGSWKIVFRSLPREGSFLHDYFPFPDLPLHATTKGNEAWYYDQILLSDLISFSNLSVVLQVPPQYPWRIDRVAWPLAHILNNTLRQDGWIDAHLPHTATDDEIKSVQYLARLSGVSDDAINMATQKAHHLVAALQLE